MKRKKEEHISDALHSFLHEMGLETPLLQYRLVQSWPEVVGPPFGNMSHALEIKGDVLWVKVSSPSLITELQMRRSGLVQRLNGHVGAHIISDIRFFAE